MARTEITVKLTQKRERLQMYLDREKYMLSPDGVQSYGIGAGSAPETSSGTTPIWRTSRR